jgi:exonuclease III
MEGHQWVVMVVYAPAEQGLRASFFSRQLHQACAARPAGASMIVAGDWNCVTSQLDLSTDRGLPARNSRLVGGAQLTEVQQEQGLEDAWRLLHPQQLDFTRTTHSVHTVTAGRTTRWLLSEDLVELGWL